jgi:hypothetical protein
MTIGSLEHLCLALPGDLSVECVVEHGRRSFEAVC